VRGIPQKLIEGYNKRYSDLEKEIFKGKLDLFEEGRELSSEDLYPCVYYLLNNERIFLIDDNLEIDEYEKGRVLEVIKQIGFEWNDDVFDGFILLIKDEYTTELFLTYIGRLISDYYHKDSENFRSIKKVKELLSYIKNIQKEKGEGFDIDDDLEIDESKKEEVLEVMKQNGYKLSDDDFIILIKNKYITELFLTYISELISDYYHKDSEYLFEWFRTLKNFRGFDFVVNYIKNIQKEQGEEFDIDEFVKEIGDYLKIPQNNNYNYNADTVLYRIIGCIIESINEGDDNEGIVEDEDSSQEGSVEENDVDEGDVKGDGNEGVVEDEDDSKEGSVEENDVDEGDVSRGEQKGKREGLMGNLNLPDYNYLKIKTRLLEEREDENQEVMFFVSGFHDLKDVLSYLREFIESNQHLVKEVNDYASDLEREFCDAVLYSYKDYYKGKRPNLIFGDYSKWLIQTNRMNEVKILITYKKGEKISILNLTSTKLIEDFLKERNIS